MTIKPILTYPGAKWRLAAWILHHLPPHRMSIEPFLGSGAVFFNKRPSAYEVLNDRDGDVVNLFRVMRDRGQELAESIELTPWARQEYNALEPAFNEPDGPRSDDPIENARRFLVRCWQAHRVRTDQLSGWRHVGPNCHAVTVSLWRGPSERLRAVIDRLKDAEIACQDATPLIAAYNQPHICLYVDPPYVRSTRHGTYYKHEMTLEDHVQLLDVLDVHRGPVLLSGYAHPLYDERLMHWQRVTAPAVSEFGRTRTEVLWLNRKAHHAQLALWAETAREVTYGK
jgi:DNA adenine methylase